MQLNFMKDLTGRFRASALLAGWPGMGSVGVGAIDYIRRKLNAEVFAEIDMHTYFTAEAVMVENGIATLPDSPTHLFYASPEHNLLIFQSEAQIGGTPGIELMEKILDVSQQFGVETVFTGAAYQMPVSHKEQVQVLGVANNEAFRDSMVPYGVDILQQGLVSGLNGLLLGFAAKRHLDAACLLGTMPQYAATIPNPKASRALVQVLGRMLHFNVDLTEIDDAVEKMESTMEDIEGQIQKAFANMDQEREEDTHLERIEEEKVPQSVMTRIEKLFGEVQQQTTREQFQKKANKLKEELDKWNLYPFYEDRFLNLFRKDGGG